MLEEGEPSFSYYDHSVNKKVTENAGNGQFPLLEKDQFTHLCEHKEKKMFIASLFCSKPRALKNILSEVLVFADG